VIQPLANDTATDSCSLDTIPQSPDIVPPSPNSRLTPVDETINLFERHMASIDSGSKIRPETYSLAVKQIVRCIGGLTCLMKENVKKNT